MSAITVNAQCKKCRRAGEKLFLKGERCYSPKCALVKRNFPPGMHGEKGFRKLTNYGQQLMEKQKAKRLYGLRERQFRNYFDKAFRKVGNTGELLFGLLEKRLDNTIFRLGLASSRAKARQLISHGHIMVNGKKVDIPSFQTKAGDIIGLRARALKSSLFVDLEQKLTEAKENMAPWLMVDPKTHEGKITGQPKLGEVEMNINWQVIVEFYSK
ncbi:30S ribosomal protein S4 [Candidatus Falkowbacteria bacterium]|nr:30S ribosomal protein S4 [Candidatus Falkowbacteria bacterium]